MANFTDFTFNSNYIRSYNIMNNYGDKFNLYTEDDSDNWFWEKFIEEVFPNRYRVLSLTPRGKRALEPYYYKAEQGTLIAVDSDYDYLCSNINYGHDFTSNPYLLHTFAYSRESALIEKSNIQKFILDVKHIVSHEVDIELFLEKLSALVFDGLIKFIYLKNFKQLDLNHDDFHKCFHLTDKNIVIVDKKDKPIIDMHILNDISNNLDDYFKPHTISSSDYESTQLHLNSLGVTQINAYRFTNGHELENLIVKILKQLTDTLLNLEMPTIRKDFSGVDIKQRRSQVHGILEEESALKTHLRRYPICNEDEIHQKILAQIQTLAS